MLSDSKQIQSRFKAAHLCAVLLLLKGFLDIRIGHRLTIDVQIPAVAHLYRQLHVSLTHGPLKGFVKLSIRSERRQSLGALGCPLDLSVDQFE
jgi:hypothetical protein